jgi:hypothetical protein
MTGILIIVNIYFTIKIKDYKKELYTFQREIQTKNSLIQRYEKGIALLYHINFKSSEINYLLSNKPLIKHLETGEKIICYMQEGVCRACIFRMLQDLSILEEKGMIDTGKVLVTTNIGNKNQPFKIPEFDYPTVHVDTFFFPEELSKEPIIFVADNQLNVDMLYLPEVFPKLRQQYFRELLPNYFKNK